MTLDEESPRPSVKRHKIGTTSITDNITEDLGMLYVIFTAVKFQKYL